jgi:hypothetical protein
MAARGLTFRQVRELLDEHGSLESAIEARPDLADQLRGVQRIAQKVGEQAAVIARMTESIRPALMRVPEPKPLLIADPVERQATAFERALARHARRQMKEVDSSGEREYTTQEIPTAMFVKAIRLLGEDEPITSRRKGVGIDEQTGLDRHLVSKIRDFTLSRGYSARPGQSPNTVVLVKIP